MALDRRGIIRRLAVEGSRESYVAFHLVTAVQSLT